MDAGVDCIGKSFMSMRDHGWWYWLSAIGHNRSFSVIRVTSCSMHFEAENALKVMRACEARRVQLNMGTLHYITVFEGLQDDFLVGESLSPNFNVSEIPRLD